MATNFKRDQINVSDELLDSLKRSEALYRTAYETGRKAGYLEGYNDAIAKAKELVAEAFPKPQAE